MNEPVPPATTQKSGPDFKRILVAILLVFFLVIVLINWQTVELKLVFFDLSLPMIIWLVVAALIGALAATVIPAVRRR
jgi:uncharacterized integral membrane protein